ncbi:MAG: aminopeptidase P N-terminal domain-containing protein [Myxococcota bacterium]
MAPVPDFAAHRARLQAELSEDEAVLVFGGPHHLRNGDAEYRYRPDSDVYWLTGWPDPHVAVFVTKGTVTMFVEPKDPERETWTGFRPGPEGAVATYGADAAHPWDTLESELPNLLSGITTLHHDFAVDAEHDALIMSSIARARRKGRFLGIAVPETFHSLTRLLHELRLVKGEDELEVMRHAARVSAEAHVAAMRLAAPGVPEYAVEAELLRVFHQEGSTGPGYTSIVAAGANATVLHYVTNRNTLEDGQLLLIDAGCEMAHYTADITRTFPVGGRFTPAQRAVYDVVLRAQRKAIDACRPGRTFAEVHDAAVRALTEGMVKLGLLVGEVDELIADESYKKYYMHGTSHWLGLDVHDVGVYGRDNAVRVLGPDMVLTVEPGLYITADDEDAPADYRGIGVRIEDDIRVTDGDPEVLTAAVPKHPDEIATLLA